MDHETSQKSETSTSSNIETRNTTGLKTGDAVYAPRIRKDGQRFYPAYVTGSVGRKVGIRWDEGGEHDSFMRDELISAKDFLIRKARVYTLYQQAKGKPEQYRNTIITKKVKRIGKFIVGLFDGINVSKRFKTSFVRTSISMDQAATYFRARSQAPSKSPDTDGISCDGSFDREDSEASAVVPSMSPLPVGSPCSKKETAKKSFRILEKEFIPEQGRTWLVRVPENVAEAWKKSVNVGKVTFLQSSKSGAEFARYQMESGESDESPTNYTLHLNPYPIQPVTTFVCKKRSSNRALRVGTVDLPRVDMRPATGGASALKKKKELEKKKNRVSLVDFHVESKPLFIGGSPESDVARTGSADLRNFREQRSVVEGDLYDAFMEKRHYRIADVVKLVHQPRNYLEEILPEVAKFHTEGVWKGFWESKIEV